MNMQKDLKDNKDDTLMSSCNGGNCPFKLDCLRFKLNGFTKHVLKTIPYNKKDCEYFFHNNQTKLNI